MPLLLLLVWLARPAAASDEAVIADVRVEPVNVFDPAIPGEDWWIFKMADKIHFTTREEVIRREILLKPAERWNALKALESERNLRQLGLFRRAEVRSVPRSDGRLDLLARTQDSWTLNIRAGAGTEGGQTNYSYGVAEDNLLGYGKSVSASNTHNGQLYHTDFRYSDQRFMGTRLSLEPFYTLTQHGTGVGTELVQPFFSLDSPFGVGANWSNTIEESILYQDSHEFSKFLLKNQTVTGSYGTRLDAESFAVQRVEGGWFDQKDQFYPLNLDTVAGTLPQDRHLSGPTLGYAWIQPRYIKETYIDKMERVEDFNMGNELQIFGGFMGAALGSDRDRWTYNALDQQGSQFGPGRFALAQLGARGRSANGRPDNTLLFANLNIFWKTSWPFPETWISHFEVNRGRSLDPENQVMLGGNNGLRGYKNYSFVGGKSLLINLENRVFFPGEFFHLVRFGGALFFDTGAVAPESSSLSLSQFKSDIGAGLRLSPTRSQSGNVVRFDVAYALNGGPGPDRWVLSIRGSQAFHIFNSSTRAIRQSPSSRLVAPPND